MIESSYLLMVSCNHSGLCLEIWLRMEECEWVYQSQTNLELVTLRQDRQQFSLDPVRTYHALDMSLTILHKPAISLVFNILSAVFEV